MNTYTYQLEGIEAKALEQYGKDVFLSRDFLYSIVEIEDPKERIRVRELCLIVAKDKGIHVVILCEHGGGIKKLEDVRNWVNPRTAKHPMTISGERLYKKIVALRHTYGFDIEFCTKQETAHKIIQILKEGRVQIE